MTTLAERQEIVGGVISRPTGLEIAHELPFNDWRRLVERLLETTDRALWSLGDAWLYGERFALDYHDALEKLEARSRMVGYSARVARAFTPERRRGQLSFEIHELLAGLDTPEQERWLNEVERHDWTRWQLQFAFAAEMPRQPVAALSIRLVEDYYRIAIEAAERRSMDPREWVLEAIREKRDREAPELEAA